MAKLYIRKTKKKQSDDEIIAIWGSLEAYHRHYFTIKGLKGGGNCKHPFWLEKEELFVRCGRCLACKVFRATEWKVRLMDELCDWHDASFVTLTYSDEHIPDGKSLEKSDLQKFFKRLRRDGGIFKYYAAGEYGEKYKRPHYHVIFFGIGQDEQEFLQSNWPFGNVYVSGVGRESIRYVTGYIIEKYSSKREDYEGREPPFSVMSKGLGKNYVLRNFSTNQAHAEKSALKMPRFYRGVLGLVCKVISENEILAMNEEKLKMLMERLESAEFRGNASGKAIMVLERIRLQAELAIESKQQLLNSKKEL